MAITETHRRGYRRAVQDAAAFAWERKLACEKAMQDYERQYGKDHQMAATERCAAREATYIWEKIMQLKPSADRLAGVE